MARASALTMTALACAALLAGCSGGGDETTTSSASPVTSFTTGPTSAPTGGGDNEAPTGSISASVQTGAVPIAVNFTLDGSDPDGDAIQWNLDLDGDGNTDKSGDSLPASEAYNYTEEGVYNVTFAISDGQETAVYNITVNATAGAGGSLQSSSGSWQLGLPQVCSGGLQPNPYHPANEAQNGVTMLSIAVDAGTMGRPFTATFGANGQGQQSVMVHFSNPDTIAIETFTDNKSPAVVAGIVPADSEMVTFTICGPAGNSVAYVAG